jgi:hypothetical protein
MTKYKDRKSRKNTPWNVDTELTSTQSFIKDCYDMGNTYVVGTSF